MSFSQSLFTDKDGLAVKFTNIHATATTLHYTVTDTFESQDSYTSATVGVSSSFSGSISDSVALTGEHTSKIVQIGTGPSSADGTFQAVEGHSYYVSSYCTTSADALVTGSSISSKASPYVYVSPADLNDFTTSLGSTSDAITFAATYAGDTSVTVNDASVSIPYKISYYTVHVSGPVTSAHASQNHWSARFAATNGAKASATLDTVLTSPFSNTSMLNLASKIKSGTQRTGLTNGIYEVTDTGTGGTTKAQFVVHVTGETGTVTGIYLKARGTGYANGNDIKLAGDSIGGQAGSPVNITLTTDESVAENLFISEGKILGSSQGLESGETYDVRIQPSGQYGFTGGFKSFTVVPSASANPVTMRTPVTGSDATTSLLSAPFSETTSDETIGVVFAKGTQMTDPQFKDVAYIAKITIDGTEYYRKYSAPTSLGYMGDALATGTTEAVSVADSTTNGVTNGDYYIELKTGTKMVTNANGIDAQSAGSEITLVDGTPYEVDILSVNKDSSNTHNAGTISSDAKNATPSGLPFPAISDSTGGMRILSGVNLGGNANTHSGRIRFGIKLVNTDSNHSSLSVNESLSNGSAITKVSFKVYGNVANGDAPDTSNLLIDKSGANAIPVNLNQGADPDTLYSTGVNDFYEYDITGRTDGDKIWVAEIYFISANGNSSQAASDLRKMSATPSTTPGTPTNGVGIPALNTQSTLNSGEVRAEWQAPESDGGSSLLPYTVRIYEAGGGNMQTETTTSTNHLFTGKTDGTTYYMDVSANNANGASGSVLTIVKTGGDANTADHTKFIPSRKPNLALVSNIGTSNSLVTADCLNKITFTIDPNSVISSTASQDYNGGYELSSIRVYAIAVGGSISGMNQRHFEDVAFANITAAQTMTLPNDVITANAGARYNIQYFPINSVYGTDEPDIQSNGGVTAKSGGSDAVVPYYTETTTFTAQPTMALSDNTSGDDIIGTKMTFSWTVNASDVSNFYQYTNLSGFDVTLSECAPIADGNGLIAYPQDNGADDYTALNVSNVEGLTGNGTTGVVAASGTDTTYTVAFNTNGNNPVYYGWKYKLQVVCKSDSNITSVAANEKTTNATPTDGNIPSNKPAIATAENSGNSSITVTIDANGKALGDTFLLSPGANGASTAVQNLTENMKVAGGVFAGGLPPFNAYVQNGSDRNSTLGDIALSSGAKTVPSLDHNLVISENGNGASVLIDGNPLGQLGNP